MIIRSTRAIYESQRDPAVRRSTWAVWIGLLALAMLILVVTMCSGCDYKQEIRDEVRKIMADAAAIDTESQDGGALFASIKNEARLEVPDMAKIIADAERGEALMNAISAKAQDIGESAAKADIATNNVQNVPGFFGKLGTWFKWGLIIAGLVVLVLVFRELGLGPLWRKIMSLIPALIPKFQKRQAALAAKAIDPAEKNVDVTHLVANLRADPVWNAAYEQAKKQQEQEKGATLLVAAKASAVTDEPVEVAPSTVAHSAVDVVAVEPAPLPAPLHPLSKEDK